MSFTNSFEADNWPLSKCTGRDLPTFTVRKVYPEDIATEIEHPDFPDLIRQFIYNQQHSNDASNEW